MILYQCYVLHLLIEVLNNKYHFSACFISHFVFTSINPLYYLYGMPQKVCYIFVNTRTHLLLKNVANALRSRLPLIAPLGSLCGTQCACLSPALLVR